MKTQEEQAQCVAAARSALERETTFTVIELDFIRIAHDAIDKMRAQAGEELKMWALISSGVTP